MPNVFKQMIAILFCCIQLSDNVSTTIGIPMYKKHHTKHVPSEQEWHGIMKDLSDTLEANQANTLSASEEILMDTRDVYNGVNLSKVCARLNFKENGNNFRGTLI